jgi:hypothetical protein
MEEAEEVVQMTGLLSGVEVEAALGEPGLLREVVAEAAAAREE